MIQRERLVALFKELCLIDAPALDEGRSVAYVKRMLEGWGLKPWEDDAGSRIGGKANNLICELPGNKSGAPRIYLSAHFDTVEPTAGLVIGEKDGVLFSESDTILGADDKGGMAPILEVVRCLLDSNEPHGDVVLLLSVAEEIGLKGADALKIEELNLDFGYVLDTGPPVGTFVTRTATHDKLEVKVIGRPAHAGKHPEEGISAIEVAAAAIAQMRLGRLGPETTANIGIIRGGTAVNVVCPSVELFAEVRSTDVAEVQAQVDHMLAELEKAARARGAVVEAKHERHYGAYHVPDDAPVVQVAQRAAQALGFPGTLRTTLGGSDANVYNAKGVPSIVVATGMDKIHTHDEFIPIKDLVATAELTLRLVTEAARG